jgi:hypothetical protein
MPLTNEEKTDLLARLAGNDVVVARQALRDAMWHLICWPFSHARVDAFFDAFERLQDLNANKAIGNIEPLIAPLARRITVVEDDVSDLRQRVAHLEQCDRASSEP